MRRVVANGLYLQETLLQKPGSLLAQLGVVYIDNNCIELLHALILTQPTEEQK